MEDLGTTVGIVALAAAAVALIALLLGVALWRVVRRVRAEQRVVLGAGGTRDLAAHAGELDSAFRGLQDYVGEVAERLDARLGVAERRLDGAISRCGLLRYDAYNEMSGRQSTSIALLDDTSSGVVLSSIHHREQARLYVKQIHQGRGELQLSPEEEEAVRLAGT